MGISLQQACGFQQSRIVARPYTTTAPYSSQKRMTTSSSTEPQQQEEENAKVGSLQTPDMAAYSSGFRTVFEEQACRVAATPLVGKIPHDLKGTYYRCGPSMFSAGSVVPPKTSILQPKSPPVPDGQDMDRMVLHPFEADGGVVAVTINQSSQEVISRFRYIRTAGFTNERRKGQRLYRAMDTSRDAGASAAANDLIWPSYRHHLEPGLNKKRKNTSNTRVIYWAKKLLTLWEGGLPYKMDELALSTEGRSQLGGILKEKQPFGGAAVLDSKSARMLFYANKQDAGGSELTIYEFNDKFRLQAKWEEKLPGFALLSDLAVTENYCLVVQPLVDVNAMQFMFNKEPGKVVKLASGASTLHMIPRDKTNSMLSIEIPFDGVTEGDLQFVNAFEEDDGTIVLDAIRMDSRKMNGKKATQYPWATSLQDFASQTAKRDLVRYTVNAKQGTIAKKILMDTQCYFGVVNPTVSAQRHQFIYLAIGALDSETAPPQGIAKLDTISGEVKTWMPAEYEFCGEPMFAPSTNEGASGEDDGYIITIMYNGSAQESEMVVLSAKDLSLETRIPLGIAIPHGLHGCFSSGDEYTSEEIERRAKLANKMESRGNMWNEVKSDFSGLGLRLDDLEEYFGDMM